MDVLIVELLRTVRKPPETIHVYTEPPSESDLEDSTHALLPRNRKRRDPRSGVHIIDPVQKKSTPTEPDSMAHNIPSPFTESIPMDQDFESPIVEEEVIPSEGAQASRAHLKHLSWTSTKDIRISELEKENSNKASNILQLQADLGGLTTLFFDLKQFLFQKFGDKFQPLSVEGEKITASSSSPANPTSQPTSKRAARPAPDANIDIFLSFGPPSAQERKEKKIKVEQLKGKLLLMNHSDQNAPSDHPKMFFRETGKKFKDK
ncbi:unnamed protein product [Lactuca saligna]|uniref:Uncharacterized protein n=1 Tax=Lactuca saligna TaxID=75948 RepID=A0AA35YSR5_LACSI|nr:unnamed protein product [Lactuca saligna]